MKTEQKWKIGDCFELLPEIPDKSIDMILTDMPYGITRNSWDIPFNLTELWDEYNRIIKEKRPIILTASQPFTSHLVLSNLKMYKYEHIWDKRKGSGSYNAKKMPLKRHENILVFGEGRIPYYPTMRTGKFRNKSNTKPESNKGNYGQLKNIKDHYNDQYYPTSIIEFSNADYRNRVHPTEKPTDLFEYLINMYTKEGDWVHDSCLGSGTTLEACMNTNRNCIGFEISNEWEDNYRKRLKLNNLS